MARNIMRRTNAGEDRIIRRMDDPERQRQKAMFHRMAQERAGHKPPASPSSPRTQRAKAAIELLIDAGADERAKRSTPRGSTTLERAHGGRVLHDLQRDLRRAVSVHTVWNTAQTKDEVMRAHVNIAYHPLGSKFFERPQIESRRWLLEEMEKQEDTRKQKVFVSKLLTMRERIK